MDPTPLDKLADTIHIATPTILLGLVGGAIRIVVSKEHATPVGFMRGGLLACFVAVLTGSVLDSYNIDGNLKFAAIGVAAFIADDVLVGILRISATIRDNPREVIDLILRRGK